MNRRSGEWGVVCGECGARSAKCGTRKLPTAFCLPPSAFRLLPSTPHSAGYTLVEMLIVVTIVGLLATAVLPTMNSSSSLVSLEAMARTLAADLRLARQLSVQHKGAYSVTLDRTNNSYRIVAPATGAPALLNPLSHGTGGNTIDLDQFGAGRLGQSHVVIGGAVLKTTLAAVSDVTFSTTGGTGPARTQDTVIWLQDGATTDRRSIAITVSWITGAVTVGDVHPFPKSQTTPTF